MKTISITDIKPLALVITPEQGEHGLTGNLLARLDYEYLLADGTGHKNMSMDIPLTAAQQTTIKNFVANAVTKAKQVEGI